MKKTITRKLYLKLHKNKNMERNDRKKIIGGLIALIAKPALNLVAERIEKLLEDDSALEKIVMAIFGGSKDLVDALSDDNPANREQVLAIAKRVLSEDILPVLEDLLKTEITPSAENLNKVADYLVESIFDIAHLLVDLENNNKQQINLFLQNWVRSDQTKNIILQSLIFETLSEKWKDNATLLAGLGIFIQLLGQAWNAIFPPIGAAKMVQAGTDEMSLEDALTLLASVS